MFFLDIMTTCPRTTLTCSPGQQLASSGGTHSKAATPCKNKSHHCNSGTKAAAAELTDKKNMASSSTFAKIL